MTATSSMQSTDHLAQICKERSVRGVATRADWERLAEINPERAHRELKAYLALNANNDAGNPYETGKPRKVAGLVIGFLVGVVVMSAWWLFGDYLHREVVTSARQWDLVTFSQYVAASLLPAFAWLGWRIENRRAAASTDATAPEVLLREASWEDLLTRFDATRKAGGTRMY